MPSWTVLNSVSFSPFLVRSMPDTLTAPSFLLSALKATIEVTPSISCPPSGTKRTDNFLTLLFGRCFIDGLISYVAMKRSSSLMPIRGR